MSTFPFKDAAKKAAFICGRPMAPCPKCQSYNFKIQKPIVMKEPVLASDTAKQLLGKWARSIAGGATPLEGPVFIMCFDCFHKGPSVDCSGRTSEEVGQDKRVADEVKRLWNDQ